MKLPHRRQLLHLAASAAALATISFIAFIDGAGSQPARTIRLVVPFPAGGSADILARLLAEQVARSHGASIVVENRPGADTVIGTEAVARAAPDGNTVLMVANPFVTKSTLGKAEL